MTAPHDDTVDAAAVIARARRLAVGLLVAAAVLAPAGLALAGRSRWWAHIAAEDTPMTWLQSCVLVLAAAGAALVALVLQVQGRSGKARRPWWVLAAGFAALAIDERFALHERVRDGVLAPREVRAPFLPWVGPGDFLVLGIALVGAALLPFVWRALGDDRAARRLLVTGAGLAAVAVGVDSIDPERWTVEAERVQQTLEEVVELASVLSLLGAVVLYLIGRLGPHARPLTERSGDGDDEPVKPRPAGG